MFRLEEFKCEICNIKFDELVERGTQIVKCKRCGAPAIRIISVCSWTWKKKKDSGRNRWI